MRETMIYIQSDLCWYIYIYIYIFFLVKMLLLVYIYAHGAMPLFLVSCLVVLSPQTFCWKTSSSGIS